MLNDLELESLQVFQFTRVGVQEILSISESTGFCYFVPLMWPGQHLVTLYTCMQTAVFSENVSNERYANRPAQNTQR